MDPVLVLPRLLGLAWLLPLASFTAIVFFGPRMGRAGAKAGYVATGAILISCALSMFSLLCLWVPNHALHAPASEATSAEHGDSAEAEHADHIEHPAGVPAIVGEWYTLGQFGALRITIGYYIDSLTVLMFTMVTLIATCIHFYAYGYMHDELHDVVDHEVKLADGHHLHRRGRFHRFSNTCRCSASACSASSLPATSRWYSSSGSWSASAPTF